MIGVHDISPACYGKCYVRYEHVVLDPYADRGRDVSYCRYLPLALPPRLRRNGSSRRESVLHVGKRRGNVRAREGAGLVVRGETEQELQPAKYT